MERILDSGVGFGEAKICNAPNILNSNAGANIILFCVVTFSRDASDTRDTSLIVGKKYDAILTGSKAYIEREQSGSQGSAQCATSRPFS